MPYLIVVWAVGLYLLHVAVLYLVYVSMTDDAHQPGGPPSAAGGARLEGRSESLD